MRPEEKFEIAFMLAEAVDGLAHHRARIMRDWPTIISLLHRESDGDLTTTLDAEQASILLRMFVHSALSLRGDVLEMDSLMEQEGVKVPRARKEKHAADEDDWEALKEHVVKDLPVLLTPFPRRRDEPGDP